MSKEFYTRSQIEAIPEPEFTNTWHPIAHSRVIEAVQTAVTGAGMGVLHETYSVKNSGRNMFASWVLDAQVGLAGRHLQVGFRNSLMKTFAVGLCAGNFITVCSNMAFSGEFVDFHKHTSGMDDERLFDLATGAISTVTTKAVEFDNWHRDLINYPVAADDFKVLTFDAMEKGLIGPNHFNAFLNNCEEERSLYGDTLFSFYGGITRQIRGINLFSVSRRTNILNSMCDDYRLRVAA